MRIAYDSLKRARTLAERGLDFEDALVVFEGVTVEIDDTRKDYGERGIISYGMLDGRLVVVGYTPRGAVRHMFSMRKANDREKRALPSTSKSDLPCVDAHVLQPSEYDELPELTQEMLDRAKVKKGGRPHSANPRKLISLRLPADVIAH